MSLSDLRFPRFWYALKRQLSRFSWTGVSSFSQGLLTRSSTSDSAFSLYSRVCSPSFANVQGSILSTEDLSRPGAVKLGARCERRVSELMAVSTILVFVIPLYRASAMTGSGASRRNASSNPIPSTIRISDENVDDSNVPQKATQDGAKGLRSKIKPTFKEALLDIDDLRDTSHPKGKSAVEMSTPSTQLGDVHSSEYRSCLSNSYRKNWGIPFDVCGE